MSSSKAGVSKLSPVWANLDSMKPLGEPTAPWNCRAGGPLDSPPPVHVSVVPCFSLFTGLKFLAFSLSFSSYFYGC